ncbi:MAG TPA: 16S rRNA (guanine(527)-N(7))-methyltransferase RsmG [Coriobacteriia bacterium]|nr:16S rRNA (guanine(527)-N(7))-methyltransferase RsmG [Coriobacteriia bacterium]
MKHQQGHVAEIIRLAKELSISVSEEDAQALLDHLVWLIETNRTHNLTSITDLGEGMRLHIVDSAAALPEIDGAPDGDLLDIGTGGGFPGVPLAILTGRHAVLLDSVGKKVRLVAEYAESVGLEIDIAPIRAEEHASVAPGRYAVVVARAVSALPSIVELAAPLLKNGGRFIALKGPISPEELKRGDAAAKKCGMRRLSARNLKLPQAHEDRTIVAYEKVGPPLVRLPRRVGMAQKQPIA